MQYNKNPISLREGHAFIDGVEVLDSVKMTVNFTPETWTGRQLGEKTPSTRWIGATITGNMTRSWLFRASWMTRTRISMRPMALTC